MCLKGVRQGGSGAHFFVHIIEDGFEDRIGQPRSQDVERLHQWHACLEQRRQLLVEHQELVARNRLAPLT